MVITWVFSLYVTLYQHFSPLHLIGKCFFHTLDWLIDWLTDCFIFMLCTQSAQPSWVYMTPNFQLQQSNFISLQRQQINFQLALKQNFISPFPGLTKETCYRKVPFLKHNLCISYSSNQKNKTKRSLRIYLRHTFYIKNIWYAFMI